MKNRIVIFALIIATAFVTSCNKEWEDEQYVHYISFRSPVGEAAGEHPRYGTGSGTTAIFVPYTRINPDTKEPIEGSGLSDFQLPMIVSGSTLNNRNYTVHVAHDPDTLVDLNYARFANRTDLYYKDMGGTPYVSYNETSNIKAGERVGLLDINFNFNNIDLADKWVLPLQIVDEGYDYVKNPRKNYSKALLRVYPFNKFSGDYSTEILLNKPVVPNPERPGELMDSPVSFTANSIKGYVVDDNTIYTYAGIVTEDFADRKLYKVNFKFVPSPSDPSRGAVEISCPTADQIGFVGPARPAAYIIAEVMDATRPYLLHRYVTVSGVDYYFNYLLPDDDQGNEVYVRYHITGSMTLARDINTQIPDEDQAIEWSN